MCNELCALCCVRSCSCCIRCWLNRCEWVKRIKKYLEFDSYPYQILTSSFQKRLQIHWLYYVFRWIIFLLCLASVVVTYGELGGKNGLKRRPVVFYLKYPIYLTYLTLLLALLQTWLALIFITSGLCKYGLTQELPAGGNLSCFQKLYWKLVTLNAPMALTITSVYWLTIYPRIPNVEADANNVLAHTCNSVYALLDMIINGLPYNFTDIIWALCYGLLYFIFTFTYWHLGGWPRPLPGEDVPLSQVIYPKCLDWTTLRHPVICCAIIVCHIFCSHIILCAIMQAKIRWMPKFADEDSTTTGISSTSSSVAVPVRPDYNKVTPAGDMNV